MLKEYIKETENGIMHDLHLEDESEIIWYVKYFNSNVVCS